MSRDAVMFWLCLLFQLPALALLLSVVLESKLKINYEKLKLPKDVFRVHLKMSLPARIATAVLGAGVLACLVSGSFAVVYRPYAEDMSRAFITTILTGSVLPFLATVIVINRLLKIRLAYRYVSKKFSNWIFLDALVLLVAFQIFFWLVYFNIPGMNYVWR